MVLFYYQKQRNFILKRFKNINFPELTLGILILAICTFIFFIFIDHYYQSFAPLLEQGEKSIKEATIIQVLNYALLILLTLFLVLIAWVQLAGLNKIAKADFLLRIDDRYGSTDIINARKIIHRIYISFGGDIDKVERDLLLSEAILNLYWDRDSVNDFIELLNFLDFLETISYFANQDHISKDEINELIGGSIGYFYHMYRPLIQFIRREYQDQSYYCQLEAYVTKSP
jgi:hypothetical protein